MSILRSAFLVIVLIIPFTSFAEEVDKTLSPYFLVLSENPGSVEAFPLKGTATEVQISGVIADVRVTQTYQNTGNSPIEAKYVFPGSTRAAVYGMKMTIGDRVRVARIKEKQEAKKIYKKAKAQGKSASLLEQQRPNVFQMSVANIMPGDEIKVELSYTELLIPEVGVYEFVYPTVVGPRYVGQKESDAKSPETWTANPYLTEKEKPLSTFDMTLQLSTGIPISHIASPSHQVDILFSDRTRAKLLLDSAESQSGNRDFVVRYKLQGAQIESGLLLHRGEDENFFLLMMEPPERVTPESIPPREYIYIVDVSGSMYGFPLDVSKKLMRDMLRDLRPQDRFNILLFAGRSALLSETSLPGNPENIRRAIKLIDDQQGGGGTEILPALQRALQLPRSEGISRTITVLTDGYVAVEPEAFDLVRNNLNGANLFAFGIGSSVNRFLIEGLARAGQGTPFVARNQSEAPAVAERFAQYVNAPLLTNIELTFDGFEVYDIEPPTVPDVFADRPVVVFGKWRGAADGSLTVKGFTGEGQYTRRLAIGPGQLSDSHSGLRYLWARHKVATLSDYAGPYSGADVKDEVTELGLRYNLLTKYTSFVAVDEIVRNKGVKQTTVKQALPLPQGVSNNAIGGIVPTVPEPEAYLLMLILSLVLGGSIVYRQRCNQEA